MNSRQIDIKRKCYLEKYGVPVKLCENKIFVEEKNIKIPKNGQCFKEKWDIFVIERQFYAIFITTIVCSPS